jgi:hypothetical protein
MKSVWLDIDVNPPPGVRFPLIPTPSGEIRSHLQVASGGKRRQQNSSSLENDPVPEAVGLAVHLLEDKFERRQAASQAFPPEISSSHIRESANTKMRCCPHRRDPFAVLVVGLLPLPIFMKSMTATIP